MGGLASVRKNAMIMPRMSGGMVFAINSSDGLKDFDKMPVHLEWYEAVLRIVLASLAGAVLGLNRSARHKPAGLRTTILVSLAAATAMVQANLLLVTNGKNPSSFSVLDLMRLPLGILTGMGFIGAGAILRKGDRIEGITTAATLWLATVVGLCLGGGQVGLGIAALIIGFLSLSCLTPVDRMAFNKQQATLEVVAGSEGPSRDQLEAELATAGYHIKARRFSISRQQGETTWSMRWRLEWNGKEKPLQKTPSSDRIAAMPGIESVRFLG
jgi:putative Mg2+ transporter-C (MgtC) family protein